MDYDKTIFKDRLVQFPNRYKDQNSNVYDFTRDEGTITEVGTFIGASVLQKNEDATESAYNATKFQEASNKAVFNGTTSKAISSTFTSIDVETIYLDIKTGNVNEVSAFIATLNNASLLIMNNSTLGMYWRITNSGNTVGSTLTQANTEYKVIFRWNGSTYDIFANGVKDTLSSSAAAKISLTKLALGFRESLSDGFTQQEQSDIRFTSTTITEQEALDITSGTTNVDTILTTANCELYYNNFDGSSIISNQGTTASSDLTLTDVKNGNFTKIDGNIENNLIAEYTVGTAAASITFGGLDLNADGGFYEVILEGASTANSAYFIEYNGITSNATYNTQRLFFTGTSVSAINASDATAGFTHNTQAFNHHKITLANGFPTCITNNVIRTSTLNQMESLYYSQGYRTAQTNITSITLRSSTSTFVVGTTVKIYKRGA
jgi:hypothetical protein